jgi:hypothetical protein
MKDYKSEKEFGIKSENDNIKLISSFFKQEFKKTYRYHPIDFISDTHYLEIKSRTNKSSEYPTTLLPLSKIEYIKKNPKPTYFVFIFTDQICYIKYDEKLFDTFEIKEYKRNPRKGIIDKEQNYIYIPVNKLSSINICSTL